MASSVSANAAPHCPQDAYVLGSSRDCPYSDCFTGAEDEVEAAAAGASGAAAAAGAALASPSASARKMVFPFLIMVRPLMLLGMNASKAETVVRAKTAANSSRQGILCFVLIIIFVLLTRQIYSIEKCQAFVGVLFKTKNCCVVVLQKVQ
jgi:hypothetical protein